MDARAARRQNCTKLPAMGPVVWQEVTRHSMRSSTFGQVQVPIFRALLADEVIRLLLQTGRSKVRQEIEPHDLLARGVRCMCSS